MERFENQSGTESFGYLQSEVEIFHRSLTSNKSLASVLVVHGFSEHSKRHEFLCNKLFQSHFDVFSFDLRGHGLSKEKRGSITSFDDYVNDVHFMLEHIKVHNPHHKIGVIGHSMGGLICVHALQKKIKNVSALVLSNPLFKVKMKVPFVKHRLALSLGTLFPHIYIDVDMDAQNLSTMQEEIESYKNDPLILKKVTLGWYRHVQKALKKAFEFNTLSTPLLMQISPDDQVVDNSVSLKWFEKLTNAKENTLIEYPNFLHELYAEKNKMIPINDVIAWLKLKT